MDLNACYRQVAERLNRIDFPALCRGFHPFPFALYDNERAVFGGDIIPRPAEFIAVTVPLKPAKPTEIQGRKPSGI